MTDHAALRAKIADAWTEQEATYRILRATPENTDEWLPRYVAWREASARHAALIHAGAVLTLGPLGDEE